MKKKIISLCLVVALVAIAVVGGTLAYFTDTDSADNTFTVGNVKIQLIEQERDGNGGLQNFTQDKTLMPIVGSAQGDKDAQGMPVAKNYVDKIVNVKNTGNQAAYVRVIMAYPSDFGQTESATDMMLHWNIGENFGTYWTIDGSETGEDQVMIGGVKYDLFTFTYKTALAKDATTATPALTGLYLDSRTECTVNYDENGKEVSVTYTLPLAQNPYSATVATGEKVQLKVFAQAVQAAGFDTAAAAFAASGLPANPWA